MTRPRKDTVEYFPHYCEHGKVLFILENKFGNDGYAVFYKILELLSKTEGHCYDCSGMENWEFLLSRMGTNEEVVLEILEKLAAMEIIDRLLWNEKRIWMQSLVDSLFGVYKRRESKLPPKPGLLYTEIPPTRINRDNNPASRVEESKVEKQDKPAAIEEPKPFSLVGETPPALDEKKPAKKKKQEEEEFILPPWIPEDTWRAYLATRDKKRAAKTPYAYNLVIKELIKIKKETNQNPIDVLNQSIKNGWTDVYVIKNGSTGSVSAPPSADPNTKCPNCKKVVLKTDIINGKCFSCDPGGKNARVGDLFKSATAQH
jgi:hypothetical protein